MSYIVLTLIFFIATVICAIYAIICLRKESSSKSSILSILMTIGSLLVTLLASFQIKIPPPIVLPLNNDTQIYNDKVDISIKSDENNCTIYYSLDGSDPRDNGNKYDYTFFIYDSTTVCARSRLFFWWSDIESRAYHFEEKDDLIYENNKLAKDENASEQYEEEASESIVYAAGDENNDVENIKSEIQLKTDNEQENNEDSRDTNNNETVNIKNIYNELIIQQINDRIDGEEVINYNIADIYENGIVSIIVTTSNLYTYSNDEDFFSRLLILDVEGNTLNNIEALLGERNSLKTAFSFSIYNNDKKLVPKTEYIIDIINDSTKELIVKYYVPGSTYGANGTAIFKYSYLESQYKLIGTYPKSEKVNLNKSDSFDNSVEMDSPIIETCFGSDSDEDTQVTKCYDEKNTYNLNSSGYNGREYWIKTSDFGYLLATVNVDKYNDSPTYINIYQPIFDNEKDILKWKILYSEYISEFPEQYSDDNLISALVEIMKCYVSLVEKSSDFGI